MTKKHATYYTDADTRQSLIDIGMKAGAKEGRAASLGLRISAAYHERLAEIAKRVVSVVHPFPSEDTERYREELELVEISRALLAEIKENKK